MESYRYIHAKSSWMTSRDFLVEAKKMAEVGATEGNIDRIMKKGMYSEYLIMNGDPGPGKSDFIATVPLVYLMANSIEALIKGFNYVANPEVMIKSVPKFNELVAGFKSQFDELSDLQQFVATYTEEERIPQLLGDFIKANEMTVDEFFNTRRHIKNTSFLRLVDRYKPFIYDQDQGRVFYQQVLNDIAFVHPIIESYQLDINEDGVPGSKIESLSK